MIPLSLQCLSPLTVLTGLESYHIEYSSSVQGLPYVSETETVSMYEPYRGALGYPQREGMVENYALWRGMLYESRQHLTKDDDDDDDDGVEVHRQEKMFC